MIYYLKHNYTQPVYFEKKKNFMNALERALQLAEVEAKDNVYIDIKIGVMKEI